MTTIGKGMAVGALITIPVSGLLVSVMTYLVSFAASAMIYCRVAYPRNVGRRTFPRRSNDVRSRIYRDDGLGRGVGIKYSLDKMIK